MRYSWRRHALLYEETKAREIRTARPLSAILHAFPNFLMGGSAPDARLFKLDLQKSTKLVLSQSRANQISSELGLEVEFSSGQLGQRDLKNRGHCPELIKLTGLWAIGDSTPAWYLGVREKYSSSTSWSYKANFVGARGRRDGGARAKSARARLNVAAPTVKTTGRGDNFTDACLCRRGRC